MRSFNLVVVLFFISIPLFSQQSRYFLITQWGDSVSAKYSLQYKDPLFKSPFLLVDETDKFDLKEVTVYQDKDGYFKRFKSNYDSEFYKRTLEGKHIQGYSKIVQNYNYNHAPGGYHGGYFTSRKVDYYTKDGKKLKQMTLKNLKDDLQDNSHSMESLQKVKTLNILSGAFYVAGAAMIIAGIASIDAAEPGELSQSSGPQISPFFIAGAITFNIPWLFKSGKVKNMKEAINHYNLK